MRRPGFQSQLCQRLATVWGDPPSWGLGSLMGQRQTGSPTTSDSSHQYALAGGRGPWEPCSHGLSPSSHLAGRTPLSPA